MDLCRKAIKWSLWPATLGLVVFIGMSPAAGQDDGDAAANEAGLQELTRGPVHEAFAEPITFNPKPGLIVKKEPPQPIEELPPEQKPDGDNVAFIGGYWSLDEDKDDWIYISGIWRVVPPGKQWVAGYFHKVDTGWQWVAGYWAPASSGETVVAEAPAKQKVEYYPEPPLSLENGANTEAPTPDHIWVSGCHIWYDNHYVWRGGYWIVSRPDWIWVPAHYVWTPCGYVFCEGGWDLVPIRRGVCFAPCYFTSAVYLRPRFYYCPRLVIDFGVCTDHFFVRPGYCHYYFGDYYADTYVSFGITPWFSFHYSRGHYCPIYSHYRWQYARNDTRWEVDLRDRYRTRVANVDQRPARTFVQQQTIVNNITINKNVNVTNVNKNQMMLAKPLKDVAKQDSKVTNMTFVNVPKGDRDKLALNAKETRKLTDQRLAVETKAAKDLKATGTGGGAGAGAAKMNKPLTLDLPGSKVVSKPVEKLSTKDAPPPLPAGALKPRLGSDKPVVGGGTGGAGTGAGGSAGSGTAGKGGTTGAGTGGAPGKTGGSGAGTGGGAGSGKTGTGTGAGTGAGTGSGSTGTGTPGKGGTGGGTGAGAGSGSGTPGKGGTGGTGTPGKTGGSGGGTGTPGKSGGSDKKPFSDGSGPTSGGFNPNTPPSGGSSFKPSGPPSGGSSNPPTSGGSVKPSGPPSGGSGGSGKNASSSGSGKSSDSGKKDKEKERR